MVPNKEVAVTNPTSISAASMEAVLVKGDLASLTAAERVRYYQSVCDSLGLNPLTQPFAYIELNKKITLYAKRDCTDQLRKINNISVQILAREVVEGCYVVTARARTPQNREDESLGAVPIDNLKGENRSNAMMKAETKAKRRVTLSICGLAFLDESELESGQGEVHTGWEGSGSKEAAAKMAADQIAKLKAGEPYRGPEPPLEETLKASIDQAKAGKKKTKLSAKHIDVMQAFGDLKKRFKAVTTESTYYGILGEYGYCHSNEFPDNEAGIEAARACYKEMSLQLADIEAEAKQKA